MEPYSPAERRPPRPKIRAMGGAHYTPALLWGAGDLPIAFDIEGNLGRRFLGLAGRASVAPHSRKCSSARNRLCWFSPTLVAPPDAGLSLRDPCQPGRRSAPRTSRRGVPNGRHGRPSRRIAFPCRRFRISAGGQLFAGFGHIYQSSRHRWHFALRTRPSSGGYCAFPSIGNASQFGELHIRTMFGAPGVLDRDVLNDSVVARLVAPDQFPGHQDFADVRGRARRLTGLAILAPPRGALAESCAASVRADDVGPIAPSPGPTPISVDIGGAYSRRNSNSAIAITKAYARILTGEKLISLAPGVDALASTWIRGPFGTRYPRLLSNASASLVQISEPTGRTSVASIALVEEAGCSGWVCRVGPDSGATSLLLRRFFPPSLGLGAAPETAPIVCPIICARCRTAWVAADSRSRPRRSGCADCSPHSGASHWCVNRIGSGIGPCRGFRRCRFVAGCDACQSRYWRVRISPHIRPR